VPPLDERVVHRISAIARGEIGAAEARRASALADPDGDAWALYHLGLRELYRFTPQGLDAARDYFERALAVDPNFASAMARLAYVRIQQFWYGPHRDRELALARAQTAASQAVELDSRNALGHFALGRVHALHGEFDLAVPAFETALRLNPSLPQAYFGLGQATFYSGQPKEALDLLATAIELDPHDPHLWSFLHDQSDAYYALGRLDEAARSAKAASCLPNATHWPLASLTAILGSAGKIETARETMHDLRARMPEYSLSFARTELGHHRDTAHVERFLDGLEAAGLPEQVDPAPRERRPEPRAN
jgi:tetratricopeptide (TPR) repeat protein